MKRRRRKNPKGKFDAFLPVPKFPKIVGTEQLHLGGGRALAMGGFFPHQKRYANAWYVEKMASGDTILIPPGHALVYRERLLEAALFELDPDAKLLSARAFKMAFDHARELYTKWRRDTRQARQAENPQLLTVVNPYAKHREPLWIVRNPQRLKALKSGDVRLIYDIHKMSKPRATLSGASDAAEFFREFQHEFKLPWDRESFWAVYLNTSHAVLGVHMVSLGSVSSSIVAPREVFRPAIFLGASAIIVFHNHPSGTASPSQEDNLVTARLKDAGDVLGVTVLDHLVVGEASFYSYTEQGYLPVTALRRVNPLLMTVTNPRKAKAGSLEAARKAYRTFHGVEAGKPVRFGPGNLVLLAIGDLKEIIYKPSKGDRKGPAWYHQFGKGAILATDPEGKKLYIVDRSGKIRVDFDRGIIG